MPDDRMQGERVEDGKWDLKPGQYSKHICSRSDDPMTYICWLVYPPVPPGPVMIGPGPFGGWEVDENPDGTISLVPKPKNSNSLQVHPRKYGDPPVEQPGWHGYIYNGLWKGV